MKTIKIMTTLTVLAIAAAALVTMAGSSEAAGNKQGTVQTSTQSAPTSTASPSYGYARYGYGYSGYGYGRRR